MIDICDELDLRKAVFVGHSVSSMVGVLASMKQPELFESLIMIGPSARYINDQGYVGGIEKSDNEELLSTMEKNYIAWANFLAPAIMQNEECPELGKELTQSFCCTDPVIAREFAEVTFLSDNRQDLVKVRHPSLILQRSKALSAPTEVEQYLQDHLPGSIQKIMEGIGTARI